MKTVINLLLILFTLFPLLLSAKSVSPFDFGYATARIGEERYKVLFKTHSEAIKRGVTVDYTGLERIDLTIPSSAKSIPLSNYCDFKGVTFVVENKRKNFFLFSLQSKAHVIDIPKQLLGTKMNSIPTLGNRDALLCIYDNNPWVQNRKGYDYGATRRDIVVVEKGVMKNVTIMPYNNKFSLPICSYYPLTKEQKVVKNVTLIRTEDSQYKTYLLQIDGQYHVSISDIKIVTPKSLLKSDKAISVTNSANVCFSDIVISGTYSQVKESGYGIQMNNVYDVSFIRMKAEASWGVFGTNNIQYARLTDCDINRFDIHCYGRDVYCKNCTFRNVYNQFSSVFGTVKFSNCSFIDCCPVLIEYSYNAYTGFDIVFEKCYFKATRGKNCIVNAGYLDDVKNERPELKQKCWPNIYINGLKIDAAEDVKSVYLMKLRKAVTSHSPLGYATSFQLENITIVGENSPEVMITNYDIPVRNKIKVTQSKSSRSSVIIKNNLTKEKN